MSNDAWVARLAATGPAHDAAVAELHDLMLRSAWHQVSRMPESATLGSRRREEIVHAAADEATMSVLSRLEAFEGRSRFTTWAYKFGILHTAVEVRRSAWRGREIDLESIPEPSAADVSPEDYAEVRDLTEAVQRAMTSAERLNSTRGALYKTLHDARRALRTHLAGQGFLSPEPVKEVTG